MADGNSPRSAVDEMIWMAWFMTGDETASCSVLRDVRCDGGAAAARLPLPERARLAVVRAYFRLFGLTGEKSENAAHAERNPILGLPPAERTVYVMRLIMGQAEQDTAEQLDLPRKAVSHMLARAAALLVRQASGQSQYA